ncbi:MAG: aminotransferase class V-fold PLP-dependent enzyme, partial [Gemmatimonadaceae bacterium]|nr:aminotransferase class V-fold PLP-dependent enzyme [Gemmatimonadaceae bacterium]
DRGMIGVGGVMPPTLVVDATDVANVEAALRENTRIVFVETIANPRTQIADLKRIGDLCRERGILYVVDNTMTQAWEAREYCRAASRLGYAVQFIEPRTPWARDSAECATRNTHGVPEAAIAGMLARWESDLTVEACLNARAPWER